jgi:RHS repeat-associated protein
LKNNRRWLIRVLAVWVGLWFFTTAVHAQTWSNGYAFRRAITIDHTKVPNSDQANFPLLISGTYNFLATVASGGGVTNANGFDIIFTSDSAGTTLLPFEQVSYSSSNGAVSYWVKVPSLSHTTDTVIYMFYGNAGISTNQSTSASVWDSNFKGVWHLSQNPTATAPQMKDSTSNANNGTVQGTWHNNQQLDSLFGEGLNFVASQTDYVSTANSFASPGPGSETLEIWFNTTSASGTKLIGFENGQTGSSGSFDRHIYLGTNGKIYGGFYSCTYSGNLLSSSTYNDGNWHEAVVTLDTSAQQAKLYVDGAQVGSTVTCSGAASYAGYFRLGGGALGGWPNSSSTGVFNGSLAEARVSVTTRSADWIATGFNNQNSPATFYSLGTVVVNGLGGSTSPYLVTISPTSGPVTTSVGIAGANFGASQGTSTVTFNGVPGNPTSWSANSVIVPVPSSATSGNVVVTVSGTSSNSSNFTVTNAPGITGMSPTSGIVGSVVTITGVNFGSTQGTSTVAIGGYSSQVLTWSNTAIVLLVPSGATTGPFTVTVSGVPATSGVFTVQALPSPWVDQDVGSVGVAGSASFLNGTFTAKGAGAGAVSNPDAFHFIYEPLSGDGTIVARIVSVSAGQAGIEIRQTANDTGSPAVLMFQNSSCVQFYYRSTESAAYSGTYLTYNGHCAVAPFWVKLVRSGNSFSGFMSPDGVNWQQVGSTQTITMTQNVYVGLVASSQSGSSLNTATLDSVYVSSSSIPAPAITSISTTTASVGSQIVLGGSGFGSLQGTSRLSLNNLSLSIVNWSDTGIVATIPSGATSGPLLVSVAPSMNDSNPIDFTVTTQPLPNGWLDTDVGWPGSAGSATYSAGVFTVKAAGNGTLINPDAFHFVYQQLDGDGTIVARVLSTSTTAVQAGVEMRQGFNDPSSMMSSTLLVSGPCTAFYSRLTESGSASGGNGLYNSHCPTAPFWVKLVRSGNSFSGYMSPDGINWQQIMTTQTIVMSTPVYVGLVAASSNGSTIATATFDNVSLSSSTLPSPIITGVSATTVSVGNQLTIIGTGFGATQNSSQVFVNDLPAIANSWSDSSINVTIPSAATSGPLVVSVAPTMNNSNPVQITITAQPIPSPWLDLDVGMVGLGGSASYSSGVFSVSASGAGVTYNPDGFHYVYQPLPGDGTIIARLVTAPSQGGIMIRENLDDPASPNVQMMDMNACMYFNYRTTEGGTTSSTDALYNGHCSGVPFWLKLVRSGDLFNGYMSPDGVNWTQVGSSQTVTMNQNVFVGLAASNTNTASLGTTIFDNVSLTIGTTPYISSVTPGLGGVGTSVTITGSSFGSTQGTSTVTFNGGVATIVSWSNTQIVATVPSTAAPGTGPVTVTVNSISSPTGPLFTVINPTISSLSPPAAQPGSTVIINGVGFGSSQASSTVNFNGVAAAVTAWSDSSISATVPSTVTNGPVTVVEDGVTSNGVQFNVLEALSVTGVSPNIGPSGTTVTITGTGFGPTQSNSVVDFFGTSAAVQSWSDTQIVATVPSGAASGTLNVTVGEVEWFGPNFTITTAVQLTDSQSHQSTYTSAMIGGSWVPLVVQGSGCSTCTQRGNISYTYDANGNALSRTDENGNTSTYTYDANGNAGTVTVPISSGHTATTSYTYNTLGEVVTTTDPLGFVTTNSYDSKGNLLSVSTPAPGTGAAASVTQFAYNALGELTSITDPLGHTTSLTYTTVGLIQIITDAQSNVTTYGYDSRGNRTSVTDANSKQTTFTYDAMNRLTLITYPDSTTTQFGYDSRGRRTSVTDQNGKVTSYTYDDADRLITVTDAASNVTTYGYDTESNLTSIQDANHNTTNFAYDAFGRVSQTTFPSGSVETYGYDNVGNLTSKTDRKNQLITYTYDQLNRLTQKSYPDITAVNYTYDNDSRLTQVTDPTGTYQFTFDNMGRLTGTSTQYAFLTSRTFTTAYSYDAASNRTGFTDPESGNSTYAYDTLNRLQTLTPPAAISGGSFGFGYDALSRRTSLTRPNSVNTTYSYDNLSRLLSVTHAKAGTTLDGATYTLDNLGNRTAKTDQRTAVATSYGYDNIYQLLSATLGGTTTESYTYDPVGNRTASLGVSTYTTNSSNEMTANSNGSYAYDANGNTITKTDSTGATTYAWDFENRLTSVTLPGTGGSVSFKYDPFGRRIYKSSSTGTSIYTYDGDNQVEETNASGGVVALYAQTYNIDEPLAMLRSASTSYYNTDGLGSVTSLSNSAGALVQTYGYDSFGKQTSLSGSLTNTFQYTAREFDSETGLYYMRARYFDPAAGRFVSEDPLSFEVDSNFYRYVRNDPTVLSDPSGLWPNLPSAGQALQGVKNWGQGVGDAGQMSWEFFSGTGPQHRDFGPGSVQVDSLRNSPGINKARQWYSANGCDSSGNPLTRTGGHKFGLKGLAQSGLDPTLQFVGSYDWKITPNTDGTVTFTVTNNTSLTSFLYQAGVPSHDRNSFGPFGTTSQTYHWTESGGCGCKH